jgi:hypothetical protein
LPRTRRRRRLAASCAATANVHDSDARVKLDVMVLGSSQ